MLLFLISEKYDLEWRMFKEFWKLHCKALLVTSTLNKYSHHNITETEIYEIWHFHDQHYNFLLTDIYANHPISSKVSTNMHITQYSSFLETTTNI
jgi:hypothetical protein